MSATASESFFTELENLRLERDALSLRSALVQERITNLEQENLWLKEQLTELRRDKFGKKSERWGSQEQGLLFNEAEVEANKPEGPDADVETEVHSHTRKRGKRKPLPKNLEREVIKIELPID